MNLFYSIVEYKNILSNSSVPLGVVLHDGNKVHFKFDLSSEKLNKILEIGVNVDPDTFFNLGKTFQQDYLNREIIITTDSNGNKIEFRPSDLSFLDYLHIYKKGAYRYTEKQPIIGNVEPEKALKQIINSI